MKHFKRFCLGLALALALCLSVLAVSVPASAHVSQPQVRCTSAFKAWYNNPTAGNYAVVTACMQSLTPGVSSNSNTANFGFTQGFGFNPMQGFNPGFGQFIPINGFGGSVGSCPADEHIFVGGTNANPNYTCVPGLGNPFPGNCPLGEHLIEFGFQGNPVWDCVE